MKINISSLPTNPGCYIYKDKNNKIIYIGKAKNIKKRVSNYFTKKNHDPKTKVLVTNINSVEFFITNNEIEALLLENNLIKKHKPKYNIDLKDSKRYAFIQLTDEEYPRLLIARKKTSKGKFFGPFTSAAERDHVIKLLRKLFKIRTCKRMPRKACLRYHINLCSAPCINNITENNYYKQIRKAKLVLKGNTSKLITELKTDMKLSSTSQNFEKAMQLRDEINALDYLSQQQNVQRQKKYDEDIINYIIDKNKVYVNLFNIYKGTLTNKQEFVLDKTEHFFEEFITRFYSDNPIPKELIIPTKISSTIKEFLEQLRKTNVQITIPKIGEKKNLLELVKKNIEITFFGDIQKVEELQKKLKLQELPKIIECFDISHLSGTSTVGSMVQFKNGKPNKSNYRRFRIRTVEIIDDFASMAEVIRRRYSRLKIENKEMPDLILIDGGKGQLSISINELKKLYLNIPIISIAKKFEEIFFPGSKFPLRLNKKEKALKFLQEIRDEAHRFAISYNRLLRKKKLKE
jgi:excinuclease ABC subunit C